MRLLIPVRSKLRLSLSVGLLILMSWCARAQDAEEFFHGGAQRFLTNNIPGALEVVTNGLQRFPDDQKLQKLYELLNQQQQQNQQQNQDQNQQEGQPQDQKPNDKDKEQQSKEENDKQGEQKKDSPPNNQGEKDNAQSKKDSSAEDPEKQKTGADSQPANLRQMSAQEAKQLLDAQKGEEQVLIFQPQGEPKNRTKQLKDW